MMAMPLIRFKRDDGSDYPDWENIELSKVFTEIKEKNRTDLPVLSVKQGYGTVLRDESGINMVYSKENLKNYKAMKKDDFIIHLRSFEGGLECSNYDGISSPAYKILRCNDFVLPNVFKHYFRSQRFISNKLSKAIIGIRDGKNIDMNVFWKISIPIPCPEEQQKIADFLSDVDNQIENYQQSLDNLESQKRELLRQVFSQELRFKRDDGSDYPDWEEDKLCNITEYRSTKANNTNDKYIGTENILQKCVGIILNSTNNLRRGTAFYKGDILSSNIRPYLKKSWFATWDGIASNDVLVFKVLKGLPKFVYLILSSDRFFAYSMNGAKPGNKMPRGDKDFIKNMDISMPCPEEQQRIADFFSDFDERIGLERQRLQTMQDLKKGLLQQMFC